MRAPGEQAAALFFRLVLQEFSRYLAAKISRLLLISPVILDNELMQLLEQGEGVVR